MKQPDSVILKNVGEWITYAEEDLAFARHGLTMTKPACRSIAFHIEFLFTHNISRLLELADELTGWLGDLAEAEELTPFATTARYPGETLRVSKKEAIRAVKIAEKTFRKVSERFAQECVKLSTAIQ